VTVLPFLVDDCERQIFIRRSSTEKEYASIIIALSLDELVRRGFEFIDKIGVENVEFVTLNDLRWRIIGAVMNDSKEISTGRGERKRDERTRNEFDCIYSTRNPYELC
jgi:hypothetical protein